MLNLIQKISNLFKKKQKDNNFIQKEILLAAFFQDSDGLIIVDFQQTIISCNFQAQTLFPHIKIGTSIKSILRMPILNEAFEELIETDKERISIDFSIKIPNEQNFYAVIIKTIFGFFIRLQDVTNQKRALKMHSDFVANVSHEMRTPLASICGFIETLQGPAKGDTNATEQFLSIMDSQAKRMKALVDGLLSLSRIELNRHISPTEAIELSSIMADVALATEPLARDKSIAITYIGDNQPRYSLGNRDEIFQVIQNLTENAIKYSPNNTHITLNIHDNNNEWGLSVTDQGRGIDKTHIPRLTERFYRVDDARNRKEGGAGLGLSIVASILARHKAHLNIESEIDKGSTFIAMFPKYIKV
jgi:two-component system phosphate regulon sensor histidine kinase PhoR